MKYIVVIAGNIHQFEAYVAETLKSMKELNVKQHSKTHIEILPLCFLYVTNENIMRGMEFTNGSKLVKIGTWYEKSADIIENIEKQFIARCK